MPGWAYSGPVDSRLAQGHRWEAGRKYKKELGLVASAGGCEQRAEEVAGPSNAKPMKAGKTPQEGQGLRVGIVLGVVCGRFWGGCAGFRACFLE